jgi:hypothetical protein
LADWVQQARRIPTLAGVVISMRQMIALVRMIQDGFSSQDAFKATLSSRMPSVERATIDGLADLAWNVSFEAMVHGKDAAPIVTPSNSAAAQAFGDATNPY